MMAWTINEAILEVIALTRSEVMKNSVSLQTQLAEGLPLIQGDRVQLQQVILNLIINAVEAMSGVSEGPRELLISTAKDASSGVLVAVQDSGPGLNPESFDRLFDAFYTTKPGGMGMGLSICRSIVEAHGGRIWALALPARARPFSSACLGRELNAKLRSSSAHGIVNGSLSFPEDWPEIRSEAVVCAIRQQSGK